MIGSEYHVVTVTPWGDELHRFSTSNPEEARAEFDDECARQVVNVVRLLEVSDKAPAALEIDRAEPRWRLQEAS